MPEPLPTAAELNAALPDLFYVATHCATYHFAFSAIFPDPAAFGKEARPNGKSQMILNAVTEATLMFVRKSAEFFKPSEANDKPDTIYSYRYQAYAQQEWIVPRETYLEFHKRVGHITIREARYGKVEWPVFPLALQAMRKWTDFFATIGPSLAQNDQRAGELCAQYVTALSVLVEKMERDVALGESRKGAS